MNWSDVSADPCLQDLPYKIELNQHGAIVMTLASNRHDWHRTEIALKLRDLATGGRAQVACSIDTPLGVKVPDVVWYSDEFFAKHG